MHPKPNIDAQEFAFLLRSAGLDLPPGEVAQMYEAYGYIERMAASVRHQRGMDAEPAVVFPVPAKRG